MKESEKGLDLSLALIVEEGALLPRVVEEVQKKVSEELQRSLDTSVGRVDIKIKGIKLSSK